MCGRYYVDDGIWNEIRKICHGIDEAKLNIRLGDVRPTDFALVLSGGKEIRAEQMRWGFASPYQDGLLINARVETATTKVSFRNSIRNCRCVIPAAGFYEWTKSKEQVSFTMPGSCVLYMAGIWQPSNKGNQFTILTTAPNASVSPVHDRMPLVLTPDEIRPWIGDWQKAEKLNGLGRKNSQNHYPQKGSMSVECIRICLQNNQNGKCISLYNRRIYSPVCRYRGTMPFREYLSLGSSRL